MIKDYVKYTQKRQRRSYKFVLWLVVALCVLTVALGFYLYSKSELSFADLKTLTMQEVTSYFPHIFEKRKPKVAAPKKVVASASEAAAPIHFDFYDELPKVKVALAGNVAATTAKELDTATEDEADEENTPPPAAAPAQPEVVQKESRENFSSKSIEQDLYADLSAMKSTEPSSSSPSAAYILQIGIFHNADAANRYRKALTSAGLKVEVKRVKQGQEVVFRLQQGPYTSMDQLKAAKKRLSERGVTCDVRKLPPYEA